MNHIAAAEAYLDALVRRDGSGVPVTADVRRVVNGRAGAGGADALREAIGNEPPLTIGDGRRWVVGTDELAVFYDLTAHVGEGDRVHVVVGERFGFRDGLIDEIEAVHTTTPGLPAGWSDSTAEGAADAAAVPAVRSYLDALLSHESGGVALAGGVKRVENGIATGASSEELCLSLEADYMHMVQGMSDERWLIAGDSAVVFYTLSAGAPGEVGPLLLAERFRTDGGEVTEIEAVFAAPSEGA